MISYCAVIDFQKYCWQERLLWRLLPRSTLHRYLLIRYNKKTKTKWIKSTILQPLITCLTDASLKVGFSIQSFGDAISTQWPCYSYPMNKSITRGILWDFELPTLPFNCDVQNGVTEVHTDVFVWRQTYVF